MVWSKLMHRLTSLVPLYTSIQLTDVLLYLTLYFFTYSSKFLKSSPFVTTATIVKGRPKSTWNRNIDHIVKIILFRIFNMKPCYCPDYSHLIFRLHISRSTIFHVKFLFCSNQLMIKLNMLRYCYLFYY